jgi:two-component system sensor histidine kinase DesK
VALPARHGPRLNLRQALRPFTTSPLSERLGDVSGRDAGSSPALSPEPSPRPRFSGDADEDTWAGRVAGYFFAGIWLVFLSDAFSAAWEQRQTLRADGGLVVLGLFVVLYLVHFGHLRAAVWGTRGSIASRWFVTPIGIAYWAALAVLAGLATVTIGQEGAATWVFLAVSGLWTFRVRIGLVIGGVLVALYEFLTFHVDGWAHDASISMSMVLAMAAVTGGMIASQRQRALAEAREENARLAIQEERNRMARDALADVRQAVAGFREMSLPAELARARSSLVAAGIEADLPTAADAVPSRLRELCAWTLREGVTNVIRHSGASTCRVTLDERGITISDNGSGAQPGPPGTGLVGLAERADAAGARLVTRPAAPHGFELSVTVSTHPRSAEPDSHERVDA